MIRFDAEWLDIDAQIQMALVALRNSDEDLFRIKVNERTITHRLALHLDKLFTGWDVDCEYSRIGDDPSNYKRLLLSTDETSCPMNTSGSRVYPDIVIHHRTQTAPCDNLLIIEVKTVWSHVSDEHDIAKLLAYTGHDSAAQLFRYKFGLFLKFDESGRVVDQQLFKSLV